MPDIVITEFMDETAVAGLRAGFDVIYDPSLVDKPDTLIAAVRTARALIVRNRTQVRGALLDAAPALKVVGRLGVGLDNIDLDVCSARNIAVKPASGANDDAVAEYAIAMALVLLRGSFMATDRIVAGAWPRQGCIGREAAGKIIGFVGFGGTARKTAVRARSLGMEIATHDPVWSDNALAPEDPALKDVRLLDLGALLALADVVSLHVPLTDGTRGLIGAQAIAAMKEGSVLINTARGGVVDEDALCEALRAGKLAGAALDVFAEEPVDATSGARFKNVPNLILTPHVGGVTEESNVRVSKLTAENVRSVLQAV